MAFQLEQSIQLLLCEGATIPPTVNSDNQKSNSAHQCVCGEYLIKTHSCIVYNGKAFCCDQCGITKDPNDIVWHCDPNNLHTGGFDICNDCINTYDPSNIKTDESNQISLSIMNILNRTQMNHKHVKQNELRDLTHHVHKIHVIGMNEKQSNLLSKQLISQDPIDYKSYIVSKADKELIISILFNEPINLKSITIYALYDTIPEKQNDICCPKQINIYKINNFNTALHEIKSSEPNVSINTSTSVTVIDNIFQLDAEFGAVQCMAILLKAGQNHSYDTVKTFTNAIELEGTEKQFDFDYSRLMHFLGNELTDYTDQIIQKMDESYNKHTKTVTEDDNKNNTESNVLNEQNNQLWQEISNKYNDELQSTEWNKYLLQESYLGNEFSSTIDSCDLSDCACLKRIKNTMEAYNKFIAQNRTMDENDVKGINEDSNTLPYDNVLVLNDFNHLLFKHKHQFEDIHDIFLSNGSVCNLSECFMLRRNYRNRRKHYDENARLRRLYFAQNEYGMTQQQLLDKIHCYYYHSFDTGYKMTQKQKLQIKNIIDENDEKENDIICPEQITKEISKLISKKEKSFDTIDELNQISGNTNSKFSTTIDPSQSGPLYSNGMRYFYWQFYKNNFKEKDDAQIHGIFRDKAAANEGYKLHEWYITARFQNLKIEITNNPICRISMMQWNILTQKANNHMKTDHVKTILCPRPHIQYEVMINTPITSKHLIAMMIYCNYTVLQSKFTETYRKIPAHESDYSMIKRHSNYAQLGRLLRENVECFGVKEYAVDIDATHYYHGITIEAHFSSTAVSIRGPTSTSTDECVAVKFAANKGLILDLLLNMDWLYGTQDLSSSRFDCRWLSNYPAEQEVFFIGGYADFRISTITLAAYGKNYKVYIAALNMLFSVITDSLAFTQNAYPSELNDQINQVCFRILSHQISLHYPNHKDCHEFKSMDEYSRKLVNSHFNNVTRLELFHSVGDDVTENQTFVIQLFKCFFFYDNDWIELDKLTRIFPSLNRIDLHIVHNKLIDDTFIYSSMLTHLKNSPSTKLECLNITFLKDDKVIKSVERIVQQFSNSFGNFGWELSACDTNLCMKTQTYNDEYLFTRDLNSFGIPMLFGQYAFV